MHELVLWSRQRQAFSVGVEGGGGGGGLIVVGAVLFRGMGKFNS